MSIIRTQARNRINFLPCDESAGTTITDINSVVLTDTSMTFLVANNVTLPSSQSNAALTAGVWQPTAAGSDWAYMWAGTFPNDAATAFGIGKGSTGGEINIGGGANISITGATGQLILTDKAPTKAIASRVLVTYESGSDIRVAVGAQGADLALDATVYDATIAGDLTTLPAFFTASNFGNPIDLMGMQLIEYPNGLPSDILSQANALFTLWEAGTKDHFDFAYEDE